MPFASEQDRFIVIAHFRSDTLNPDGNWSSSLQSCIEKFMQQYPDEMIEYDIFLNSTNVETLKIQVKSHENPKRNAVIAPFISECICASGADSAIVEKWQNLKEYANNACFKCFIKCMSIKTEFLDSVGSLHPEITAEKYGIPIEITQSCEEEVHDELDLCEKSFKYAKCIKESH
ncbi:hypothetical protein FQA39_LY15668 [Lamprigera yunnana]|nr:hypothetical protein FQA39_LY15668 [Lamprigera yunnana]